MPLQVTFELSDSDLEHLRQVMVSAREKTAKLDEITIIDNARKLLFQVWHSETSEYIRERMNYLETMIGMVADKGWGLEDEDRQHVLQALAYFSEPEDLIPDDIPGLGFLDDAIMIEIVTMELKHENQAYRDFCVFRAEESNRLGEDAMKLERSDWLEDRRKQLHSRMRRRKTGGRSGSSSKSGSRFSLFGR
jgi:uncharacterized membrane protein YkvA (DUF1232 family)